VPEHPHEREPKQRKVGRKTSDQKNIGNDRCKLRKRRSRALEGKESDNFGWFCSGPYKVYIGKLLHKMVRGEGGR